MKRFELLTDAFGIKCKRCGGYNVRTSVDVCNICGEHIKAECDDCGNIYDSHAFETIED